MGDNSDLKTTMAALAAAVTALQATAEATKALEENTKAIAALFPERPSSSSGKQILGDQPQPPDRPPKFQKLDFPRYDGKSDPLIFVSRCESVLPPAAHHGGREDLDGLVQS